MQHYHNQGLGKASSNVDALLYAVKVTLQCYSHIHLYERIDLEGEDVHSNSCHF